MENEKNEYIIYDYFEDGSISEARYYLDGSLHRDDGPAVITYAPGGDILESHIYKNGVKHSNGNPTNSVLSSELALTREVDPQARQHGNMIYFKKYGKGKTFQYNLNTDRWKVGNSVWYYASDFKTFLEKYVLVEEKTEFDISKCKYKLSGEGFNSKASYYRYIRYLLDKGNFDKGTKGFHFIAALMKYHPTKPIPNVWKIEEITVDNYHNMHIKIKGKPKEDYSWKKASENFFKEVSGK